jgi:myo-inositol-1(or 4)-monophosphatase
MTYVACGKMDAFYETTLNPWDIAGGTILVREAGGTVTDFQGGGDFAVKRQLIASNSLIHGHISTLLDGFVDEHS